MKERKKKHKQQHVVVKSVRYFTHSEDPDERQIAVTVELRFTEGRMARDLERYGLTLPVMRTMDREMISKIKRMNEGKDHQDAQNLLSELHDAFLAVGIRKPYAPA
jgi:hypothetical protein